MKRLWLLIAVITVLVSPLPVSAVSVEYDIDSSYILGEDLVAVEHEISISGAKLGDQTITVAGRSDAFKVSGGIDFEQSDSTATANGIPFRATDLTLKLGSKTSETFTISYKTADLHGDYKQADSVFVPPFDVEGTITAQSINLTAPLDLELGNIIGAEITDATTIGGEQTYVFEQNKAFERPIVLQLGSLTTADVEIKSRLENSGFWWSTQSVVLPMDTNQQRSFVTSIEPKPSIVRVDTDGNIIAEYNLRPRQTIDVTAKAKVVIEQKLYDLETESGFQQIEQDLIADYTSSTKLWPTSVLKSIDLNAQDVRQKDILKAIKDIQTKLIADAPSFNPKTDFTARNANDDIEQWSSVDYADRLIGGLRAVGIPARMVGGVVTDNQMTRFEEPTKAAWVEAYVPDIGWMTVDPVLNKTSNEFFGQAGLQKIGYFIWGVSDHIPEFQNDQVSVTYNEDEFPEDEKLFKDNQAVSGQNFMLLPGVSVLRSVAQMPEGIIHDEVTVRALGVESDLGSLAPLQQRQTLRFVFGSDSWQSIPLSLVIAGDPVSKGSAGLNFLLVGIEVILLGVLVWIMLKWRKKRTAPIVLHDDDSKDYVIEGQDLLHGRSQTESETKRDPLRDDAPPGP